MERSSVRASCGHCCWAIVVVLAGSLGCPGRHQSRPVDIADVVVCRHMDDVAALAWPSMRATSGRALRPNIDVPGTNCRCCSM